MRFPAVQLICKKSYQIDDILINPMTGNMSVGKVVLGCAICVPLPLPLEPLEQNIGRYNGYRRIRSITAICPDKEISINCYRYLTVPPIWPFNFNAVKRSIPTYQQLRGYISLTLSFEKGAKLKQIGRNNQQHMLIIISQDHSD